MKYRYTRFTGDELDDLDLEDLVAKLSDLLLSSGFGNPYAMDDDDRTMQALHDAILDALFNGGVLPEETIERLLSNEFGRPCKGRQMTLPHAAAATARTVDAAMQCVGLYHSKIHVLGEMDETIACSTRAMAPMLRSYDSGARLAVAIGDLLHSAGGAGREGRPRAS